MPSRHAVARSSSTRSGAVRAAIAILLLVGASVSCSSTEYIGTEYAPTTSVRVYFDEDDIDVAHSIMGIAVTSADESASLASIEAALVKQAMRRGADAIVIDDVDVETTGYQINGQGQTPLYWSLEDGAPVPSDPDRWGDSTGIEVIQETVVTARLVRYDR